jgi:5-methylcytosine-specific restriction endonuclease McrA
MIGLRTLVLNANYMPISLLPLHSIPVEDAITRIFSKNCHVVFEYNRKILSPNIDMRYPSVVARNNTIHIKNKVKLKKESLFYRDHGICVYCEKRLQIKDVTYDHVFPRSKGGEHSWENVVCSCASCNTKKGQSLPVGNWKLPFKPYEPDYYELLSKRKQFPIVVPDSSWVSFLYDWNAEVRISKQPI